MKHYLKIALLTMVFVQGCATPALVDAVKPNQKIMVPCDKTSEEELQRKGRKYTKREDRDYYMVEKTRWRKIRDYAVLGVGLPFAVAADGVIVVAAIAPLFWPDGGREKHHGDDFPIPWWKDFFE